MLLICCITAYMKCVQSFKQWDQHNPSKENAQIQTVQSFVSKQLFLLLCFPKQISLCRSHNDDWVSLKWSCGFCKHTLVLLPGYVCRSHTRGSQSEQNTLWEFFFREGKTKTTTDLHEGPVRHFYTVNFSVILVKSQRKKRVDHKSSSFLSPLTGCRQQAPLAACAHCVGAPWRHFLKHTCRWSQTLLHQAGRNGWWQSPVWAAGGWLKNLQLHVHKTARQPGLRWLWRAKARCLHSPAGEAGEIRSSLNMKNS